jgi:outer membrane lipoprotein carrier protein
LLSHVLPLGIGLCLGAQSAAGLVSSARAQSTNANQNAHPPTQASAAKPSQATGPTSSAKAPAGQKPAPSANTGVTPPATQTADGSRVTLAAVQVFYEQTKDVSADFQQTYVNKLYDRTDRSRGHVVFKKPGKMRWDYAKPNGKVIVASSSKLTVYEPGDEPTDKGQVLQQNFAQAELPQAMSFLLGTGKLSEDFDAKLLDATREGFPNGQVLELKPKQPSPHFDRLLFYVETSAALRGLVRRIVIIDASGNRNRFDFSALKFNANVPESTFEWKPPADARRVQL